MLVYAQFRAKKFCANFHFSCLLQAVDGDLKSAIVFPQTVYTSNNKRVCTIPTLESTDSMIIIA